MASNLRLNYRRVETLLCMSTLIASAQTVPNPNPAIQNAGTTQKSGTLAPINPNTPGVPSPDLKPFNLPPVDVPERTKQTLDDLDLATRYYREIAAPLQTVGEPNDVLYREEAVNDAKIIGSDVFKAARAEAILLMASAPNNSPNRTTAIQDVQKQQILEERERVRREINASQSKMNGVDEAMSGGGTAQVGILRANKKKLQQYLESP